MNYTTTVKAFILFAIFSVNFSCDDDCPHECGEYHSSHTIKHQVCTEATEIFIIVEDPPSFGVEGDLERFFLEDIELCEQSNIQNAQIVLRLIILKSGKACLSNVIIREGRTHIADPFVERLKVMPLWKPGSQRGRNVEVLYNLPIFIKNGLVSLEE